ncbi:MAG: hypothetical protein ACR2OZ_13655 [Verrucomicrobiales bacterium]
MSSALLVPLLAATTAYFEIQVLDEATERGVPLVELKTVHRLDFMTDNAGRVAFHEPGLMEREVFFFLRSHGYEYPKDGFGFAGARLTPKAGGRIELKIKRRNIAERLYRVTGEGQYRDTVLLGKPAPLDQHLLNGLVVGQDSTQAVPYRDLIFWTWGDTNRTSYPLGLFRTAGATSKPPSAGGLEPDAGIDLTYFMGKDGFARGMVELEAKEGLVWVDGLCTVAEEGGRERLICHFSRRKDLTTQLAHGIAVFDDTRAAFVERSSLPADEKWRFPRGHPTRAKVNGVEYLLIGDPFLHTRVPATLASLLDPMQYEAWNGTAWSKTAPPSDVAPLTDVETDKAVKIHAGSCRWNVYRQRWLMIANEVGGQTSNLGEVWYAEAPESTGPWRKARRVATHDRYSFYNPVHHDFFDQDGGRLIYFEGTYSGEFSRQHEFTPRYDYNQIMYRLDLDDERLRTVRQ